MTEVALPRGPGTLASPSSRASSSSSSTSSLRYLASADSDVLPGRGSPGSTGSRGVRRAGGSSEEEERWSFLALLFELLRKSLLGCRVVLGGGGGGGKRRGCGMEIGLPTDVRHVAHVTFDRFHGFLGLPVELEPEGGLQAEGIFHTNAENNEEEFVRDQLNSGNVPDGSEVHCLAGLIKAWFREMPSGVLDSIPPEQKDPSDENGHQKPSMTLDSIIEEGSRRPSFVKDEPLLSSPAYSNEDKPNEINAAEGATAAFNVQTSTESSASCSQPAFAAHTATADASSTTTNSLQGKRSQNLNSRRTRKGKGQAATRAKPPAEKSRDVSIVSQINSKVERIEAWR